MSHCRANSERKGFAIFIKSPIINIIISAAPIPMRIWGSLVHDQEQ